MKNLYTKLLMLLIVIFPFFTYAIFDSFNFFQKSYADKKLTLLFTGDIFLDRGVDIKSQKSSLKFTYPFQGLDTFQKGTYDAWIGNLECPVTTKQSTMYEKENYLKFSCKKEYLPELKKYFDIVSLANNHTDNMGNGGIEETRKYLEEAGLKYFGDFDNSNSSEVCKIIYIKDIPIVYCGFNGVYKLPTDKELSIVNDYSQFFVTIVMPHQGVEYAAKSNTYQKLVYKKIVDLGADAVIGSHPHVIEEVEEYKGKLIFYSLGNFIFDQTWQKTKEHMEVEMELNFPKYPLNYAKLDCKDISSLDCLKKAKELGIEKPELILKYKPIFSSSDTGFITKKTALTDKEYTQKLKNIGFDKVASTSKIDQSMVK